MVKNAAKAKWDKLTVVLRRRPFLALCIFMTIGNCIGWWFIWFHATGLREFIILLITLAPIFIGIHFAQLCLLSMWSVMANSHFFVRTGTALGAVYFLCYAVRLGVAIAHGNHVEVADFDRFSLLLPLFLMVGQTILWPLRWMCGGWCDVRQPRSMHAERRILLADLFALTAFIGGACGLARISIHLSASSTWMGVGIACVVIVAYSGIGGWMCFWAIFIARRRKTTVAIVLFFGVFIGPLVGALLTWYDLNALELIGAGAWMIAFGLAHLAMAVGLLSMLGFLRWSGFRTRRELALSISQAAGEGETVTE